ncbi:putative leader peptide [Streptomyces sp. MST-110588]|uniref:putative leader peptide n=1 Tax=Streptomyces sp. MST-110588 TaxID=2833628 RepID=UPI001F5DC6FE|nr:putative leader peptide [Streptomyces sp. MST-110588]UNO41816.1 hypothetical protein KGS77_22575 [Streptomyces sp. MST-110588]
MVLHDVSDMTPGSLAATLASRRSASAFLGVFGCGAARLHVDLCRLASAMCTGGAAA